LQHELYVAALIYGIEIPDQTGREFHRHVPESCIGKMFPEYSGTVGIRLSDKNGREIRMSSSFITGEVG